MKLSHGLGLALAGICSVGLFVGAGLSTGCGSSSGGSGSSSGGSSSGSGAKDICSQLPTGACDEPPSPVTSPAPTGMTPHNYALHKLYMGDTDRMGVTNPDAWKSFGYDLDGKDTTAASTDVCSLVTGASKQVQIDGNGGIDNSFGANIMPIIGTLDSTASQTVNQQIQNGGFTVMTYVVGFDDSAGNMTTAGPLTGVLLAGGNYPAMHDGGAPTWDMNTHWPIRPELLNCFPSGGTDSCTASTDPIAAADVQFKSGFQTKGTFVNGTPSLLSLSLTFSGNTITLNVHSAIVSFDPQAPGSVTNGTIAGVINTEELIAGLKQIAGHISTSLCSGSAFQSIASQIEQTSDIVVSGDTVSNPAGTTCNGISVGLGFDSSEIALPTGADIAPMSPPGPDPCADAGSD
jgi:hypothetical protein